MSVATSHGGGPAPRTHHARAGALLVVMVLLAGCGFRLQGSYQLPPGVDGVYVSYDNAYQPGQPPLVDALQQRLRMLDALGGPTADARLVIRNVGTSRTGISVSAIDSETVEYRLRTSVVFDYIVNQRALLRGEHFAVTRYYSYSDAARLAAETERRELSANMQRQLVDRILFRIKNMTVQERNEHE